ncbi:MAG: high-potential iron-sulfur protein [Oligoflexales bacterium]
MALERRNFLKGLGLALAGLPVLLASKISYAAKKLVSEDDPVAKALKYTHDAATNPLRTKEKMGVQAKDQACKNCAFFSAAPKLDGVDVGNCAMIASGVVKATGWCNSWAAKK